MPPSLTPEAWSFRSVTHLDLARPDPRLPAGLAYPAVRGQRNVRAVPRPEGMNKSSVLPLDEETESQPLGAHGTGELAERYSLRCTQVLGYGRSQSDQLAWPTPIPVPCRSPIIRKSSSRRNRLGP